MASIAAVRAGADLVTVASPARSADVAAHTLPDLITYPLRGDYLTPKHLSEILELSYLRKINSVVIGCGLGRHPSTLSAVRKLIAKFTVPLVLDADALVAVSFKPEVVFGKHVVLTPHAGELAVLLKIGRVGVNFNERMERAKQAALKYKALVLLKGHIDIVTDGQIAVTNNTGCAQMTKGGTGDTLAGILGALLGRGVGLMEAAHVAAFINGKAGEYVAQERGDSFVASDMFDFIPRVINTDR